jgi:carboxymethylenebutenolidase
MGGRGRRRAVLALLLLAAACAERPGGAADPWQAVEALPAAIRGTAREPAGQAVHYFEADPMARGYLAMPPSRAGPYPAVLLIHEWNGVTRRLRQLADALADEGYVALAADLFSGRVGTSPEENMALVREATADPARVVENLDAAVRYLRGRPEVTGRIATIGWCFGGGIALSYALGGENHEGTAIFYGSLIDDPERLAGIRHEVYGTFAGLDRRPAPDEVQRFVDALRQAGVPHDIHIYDDVDHGFWLHVDQDVEARAVPALDAWQRLRAYLSRALRAPA